MKFKLKKMIGMIVGAGVLASGDSSATNFQDLPVEMVKGIYSFLNLNERREARFNHLADAIAVGMSEGEISITGLKFKEKIERIEKLLELNQFISLPDM